MANFFKTQILKHYQTRQRERGRFEIISNNLKINLKTRSKQCLQKQMPINEIRSRLGSAIKMPSLEESESLSTP